MLVPFRLVTRRVRREERVLRDEIASMPSSLQFILVLLIFKDEIFTAGQRKKKKKGFFTYLRNEHHSCILNDS